MDIINKLKKSLRISKRTLNIVIILSTLTAAVYYFYKHHTLLTDLKKISPFVAVEVFFLYILMLAVLILIYQATMKLVNIKISFKENGLINAYSLFMNFFIPGQTGPAFRAYYMKKNYSLKYLNYTLSTIFYYLIYGLLSVIFILVGSQPIYLSLPVILIFILIAVLAIRIYLKKKKQVRLELSIKSIAFLTLATFCQVVLQSVIYFIEIHSITSGIHFNQVITYTGVANLALFAALTPGAIGIREGLLILTEKLNHVTSNTIVLANVIDRSVYIIFLLILGILIAGLKIKQKLGVSEQVT